MATGTMESLWSKANQAQVAYIETGSTASKAYAAGELFCWNGLLYRAKTAISSGASFTDGTNCEQTTVAGQFRSVKMFKLSQESGTTSALGNLELSISPNAIIVGTRTSQQQAAGYIGRGSNGNYYCHIVNSSGNALANTSVTLDVYYVDS